jgi:ketosteroid isomerase-like protein
MAEASSQERNVELARRGFDAYNSGDSETLAGLLREDVEIHASQKLLNAGDYQGEGGFAAWNAQWREAWEEFVVEPTSIEPMGDRYVLADAHQSARGAGSGVSVEMDVFWAFEVENGGVKRMHLYATREDALAAIDRWQAEAAK